MKLPGGGTPHAQAPPRIMVTSVAQLLLGACTVVMVWEVGSMLYYWSRYMYHLVVTVIKEEPLGRLDFTM